MTKQGEGEINWGLIDELIKQYEKRHPEEYRGALAYTKQLRDAYRSIGNEFALQNKDNGRRHMCELPNGLMLAIETIAPLALQGKNLITFLRRYKQFCIPPKL